MKSVCFNYVVYVKSTPQNSLSHFLPNACCLANSPENWHNQSTQHMHAVKELCHYHTRGMTCLGRNKTTETFIRFWISKAPNVTSKLPVTKTCSTFHISRSHLYRQKKYLHHLSISGFLCLLPLRFPVLEIFAIINMALENVFKTGVFKSLDKESIAFLS